MAGAQLPSTRTTLLARLRKDPANEAAWGEFVEHYGRHIHRWCRQWNLQDADAEDVTQEILVKLAQKLRGFVYDPSRSFRGWLKTIAPPRLERFCRQPPRRDRRRRPSGLGTGANS